MEFLTGDPATGQVYLDRLLDPARRPGWGLWDQAAVAAFIPLIARLTGDETQFELAETEAQAALSSAAAPFQREFWPRLGLALIAVARGDAAAAAEQYAWLEHQQGTVCIGPVLAIDRVLGLLAGTMQRAEAAIRHFENSLVFCEHAGYRPEYAWTASDYSEALLDQPGGDNRQRAVSLQEEALEVAQELGMTPLTERVLARREILKA